MVVQRGDARWLPLSNETVDCVVTSPPYNTDQPYQGYKDALDWLDYGKLADMAAQQMYRVLKPSGRCWVNVMPSVPQEDKTERIPLSILWLDSLTHAGFEYRDTVVWMQDSYDGACAWGSWRSPSSPNLRGGYEHILYMYKPPYKRKAPAGSAPDASENWTDMVRNVWTMRSARRRKDAPAPFPLELPERCILLSTWPGETVLDPFAGSGVTIDAAEQLGRVGLGYDVDAED